MPTEDINTIEQQIWEYIDNSCTDDHRLRIEKMIRENDTWRATYASLTDLNKSIKQNIHNIEIQSNITSTVLSKLSIEPTERIIERKYYNYKIIAGITAIFTICIAASLVYFLAETDIFLSTSVVLQRFDLQGVTISRNEGRLFMSIAIGANVILGLALLDIILRSQKLAHLHKR